MRSLRSRAARHGVLSSKLLLLMAGATLLASVACAESAPEPVPDEEPRPAATPFPEPETYVVEPQDTLARIAVETGVPLATLVELNEIADPNIIEVGDVLLLEPAPLPTPNLERSIVSREPVDRSFSTRLGEWWDGLYRPDLNLSERSLSQGAVAGLMLPAAVLAFVALWLGWHGVRRAAIAMASFGGRAFGFEGPRYATGGSAAGSGAVTAGEVSASTRGDNAERSPGPSTRARLRRVTPRIGRPQISRPTLPRPSVSWRVPRPSVDLSGLREGVGHRVSALVAGVAAAASRLGRTPAVVTRRMEARRERAEELAARQEAEAHWLTGAERLRIGLIDEAYTSFNAALRVARAHGWQDEIDRNLAALDDIAARRQAAETPTSEAGDDEPAEEQD